jgi:hypothetical protein
MIGNYYFGREARRIFNLPIYPCNERQYFDEQKKEIGKRYIRSFGFDPCLKESHAGHLGRCPCDTIRYSSRNARGGERHGGRKRAAPG